MAACIASTFSGLVAQPGRHPQRTLPCLQVVVDDAQTAKSLLERGGLRKRVTIIPLDKVRPKVLNNRPCRPLGKVRPQWGMASLAYRKHLGLSWQTNCWVLAAPPAACAHLLEVWRQVPFRS